MWGALDIPTSGMVAQRMRLDVISANIANRHALLDANGNFSPYRKRIAEFAPGDPGASTRLGREMGVHVAHVEAQQDAVRKVYEPSNPYADASGYVLKPDIDPIIEQVNALEATRSYEANVVAAEAIKSTMAQALRLLA